MSIDELRAQRETAQRELDECITRQAGLEAAAWHAQVADEANDARMDELSATLADLDRRLENLEATDRPQERGVAGSYHRARGRA